MNDEEEPFLKRWSRRKIEAKEGPDQSGAVPAPAQGDAGASDDRSEPEQARRSGAEAGGEPAQKRVLTEADFADVDFEALDFNSDYSRFTAPDVPETIKNKALQKLWASDPIFTAADPFQDYQGDYTDAAVAVPAGTLKTAYRIGRGFMTDEDVAAWEKLGKPPEEKVAAAVSNGDDARASSASPTTVQAESADQPEVHALLRQSDTYMAGLYPAESNHLIDVAALSEPRARFLIARCDGVAVGCGALLLGDNGEAEIKRMFVAPEARGARIGRQILSALEEVAKGEGVRVIRLETGTRQPEALGLYRRHGYTERGPFGAYQADPLSRYFEKWIG
jgi:putative acetyltransferase